MISPRKKGETAHGMSHVYLRPEPDESVDECECPRCFRRVTTISMHPIGLSACPRCISKINKILRSSGFVSIRPDGPAQKGKMLTIVRRKW